MLVNKLHNYVKLFFLHLERDMRSPLVVGKNILLSDYVAV